MSTGGSILMGVEGVSGPKTGTFMETAYAKALFRGFDICGPTGTVHAPIG